jgi:hypothetical protein
VNLGQILDDFHLWGAECQPDGGGCAWNRRRRIAHGFLGWRTSSGAELPVAPPRDRNYGRLRHVHAGPHVSGRVRVGVGFSKHSQRHSMCMGEPINPDAKLLSCSAMRITKASGNALVGRVYVTNRGGIERKAAPREHGVCPAGEPRSWSSKEHSAHKHSSFGRRAVH